VRADLRCTFWRRKINKNTFHTVDAVLWGLLRLSWGDSTLGRAWGKGGGGNGGGGMGCRNRGLVFS